MTRWTLAAALTLMSGLAQAQTTESVTLPTGRTVQAEVVSAPAEGTVEKAILTTLQTIIAGDFSTFLASQCDPNTCSDARQQSQLTQYNLPAAQQSGPACLHGETHDQLWITKRREQTGTLTVYLWCGEGRMPAPSTWKQIDGAWKTSSFSW